ncbi:MAG: enoyl-CoA hydratase/isomerase family protein [Chloroflexi bacterium]|nr:enoyl-CoA hydratase/isomerase family protein [Chloroflexota bacterium]
MSLTQLKTLLYRSEHGVAWLTLNRPVAQNRVNLQMATELRDVCQQVQQDNDVRVVVLTGAGESFCVGDEDMPAAIDGGDSAQKLTSHLESRRTAGFLGEIEKPVVVAMNGDALGHGLEMALACDIRLAVDNARMGLPQIVQGGMPWDGGTQRLPRIVGRAWAADLLLTGKIIDAAEALRIGLVHQVVPSGQLMVRAEQLADTIAALGPVAARYAKEAVFKGMDMTLGQGMRLEMDLNLILQTTEDRAEGIASFLERRRPIYKGE